MLVLHVITDLSLGGGQKSLFNIVRHHKQQGVQVHVIALRDSDVSISHQLQALGISVQSIVPREQFFTLYSLCQLVKIIQTIKPDIIQTWLYHADFLGGLCAWILGIPVIWGVHHADPRLKLIKRSTFPVVFLNAFLSRWIPKKIIGVSQSNINAHIKIGYEKSRFVFIPNGVDVRLFSQNPDARISLCRELGLDNRTIFVGMFARYNIAKDFGTLIAAFEKLHAHNQFVHLILCGQNVDPHNSKLINIIDACKIRDYVHLLGNQTDMAKLFSSLDVFVMSSRGEAFPMALVEAMACGIPAIVTRAGDMPDVVGEQGRVVDVGDVTGMMQAILDILSLSDQEKNTLSANIRRSIVERYSIEYIAIQYLQLYESVLGETVSEDANDNGPDIAKPTRLKR